MGVAQLQSMNLSAIDDLKPYAVGLAQQLIQFPTENPPGRDYYNCAEFLKKECETLGLETEIVQVEATDRYNVLAWTSTRKTDLHFHYHYDVVPAGHGWAYNPFNGSIVDGTLYGRGSSDMKGGIAAVFTALKAVQNLEDISISVSLTPDEETGGALGAEYVVKNQLVDTKMAVLPEPTGLKTMFNACKGALWVQVTVHGEAGHPSVKGLGVNAFDRMVVIASRLQKLKEIVEHKKSALHSYPEGGEWANLTLGERCSSGEAVNAVPGQALFTIDRRTLPEEDLETAQQEIRKCIGKDAEITVLMEARPFHIDEQTDVCQLLNTASETVMRTSVNCALCPGFLDARHFVHAGIPCVTWGPGIYGNAHISNEFIRIEDMMTAAKVFYVMATTTT